MLTNRCNDCQEQKANRHADAAADVRLGNIGRRVIVPGLSLGEKDDLTRDKRTT